MIELACAAPIVRGPRKGSPATGSVTGWGRHYRAGEPPCDACVAANRAHKAPLARRWRQGHNEATRRHKREYRLRHPDRVREANRRFRQANTEYPREYLRAWKAANPEKVAAWHVNRRARMRGAAVIEFSPEELAARLAYFGHSCWMCGEPAESVDHVKPLARGGAHMLCNLRPACVSCNSAKGATWPFAT